MVLIVNEADRLQAPVRDALTQLLRNTPPKLRIVAAARADFQLGIDDLTTYGQGTVLGPMQLRFRVDETMALVRARFGALVDRDGAARLHELTEGWSLGLQLALSVMAAGEDPLAELAGIAGQCGATHAQLDNLMLSNLFEEDLELLIRISILDLLYPACAGRWCRPPTCVSGWRGCERQRCHP